MYRKNSVLALLVAALPTRIHSRPDGALSRSAIPTAILHAGRVLGPSQFVELSELDFSMVRFRLQRIGIVLQWNLQLSHLVRDQTSCAPWCTTEHEDWVQREAGQPVGPVHGLSQIANQQSK